MHCAGYLEAESSIQSIVFAPSISRHIPQARMLKVIAFSSEAGAFPFGSRREPCAMAISCRQDKYAKFERTAFTAGALSSVRT